MQQPSVLKSKPLLLSNQIKCIHRAYLKTTTAHQSTVHSKYPTTQEQTTTQAPHDTNTRTSVTDERNTRPLTFDLGTTTSSRSVTLTGRGGCKRSDGSVGAGPRSDLKGNIKILISILRPSSLIMFPTIFDPFLASSAFICCLSLAVANSSH